MNDLLGTALLDYYRGDYSEDIRTETNISEEDELSLPYLFRSYSEMLPLDQQALKLAKGKVLDVGCGAGNHALLLQGKGLEVTAIDISEGAVEVATLRGVTDARKIDLLDVSEEKFDTILLLMNGTGIFQKMALVPKYLQHLKSLLAPNGQILTDTCDLRYMYDAATNGDEPGGIWVPADRYYGELEFVMKYKGEESDKFPWLYLDDGNFERLSFENGLHFEVVGRGENFDYLARLTVSDDTPD